MLKYKELIQDTKAGQDCGHVLSPLFVYHSECQITNVSSRERYCAGIHTVVLYQGDSGTFTEVLIHYACFEGNHHLLSINICNKRIMINVIKMAFGREVGIRSRGKLSAAGIVFAFR